MSRLRTDLHCLAMACALGFTAVTGCATAPGSTATEKLRAFARLLEQIHKEPLTANDRDANRVEQAGFAPGSFPPSDEAALAELLRLDEAILDNELPYVAEFGLSDEGRGFARPLAILLVRRSQLAAAAELVIAAARLQPEGKRAYSTWRWWETVFGKFENFQELDTAFSLALLDRFALSDAADRRVLAELFGRPDMTTTDVAAMKKAVLEGK